MNTSINTGVEERLYRRDRRDLEGLDIGFVSVKLLTETRVPLHGYFGGGGSQKRPRLGKFQRRVAFHSSEAGELSAASLVPRAAPERFVHISRTCLGTAARVDRGSSGFWMMFKKPENVSSLWCRSSSL